MIDFTKLREKLDPDPGGEDVLRPRTAIVSVVNADGTLDLLVSGVLVPGVPRLASVSAVVGNTVQVITIRGALLVIGQVATSAVGQVSNRVSTTVRTSDSAGLTTETAIDIVSGNLVSGRTYRVTWDFRFTGVAGDTVFGRIRENNIAGAQLQTRRFDGRLTNGGGSGWACREEVEYTAVATGSKTFSATLAMASGTGPVNVVASSGGPAYLYIDFIR